jgi:hypothetical protein
MEAGQTWSKLVERITDALMQILFRPASANYLCDRAIRLEQQKARIISIRAFKQKLSNSAISHDQIPSRDKRCSRERSLLWNDCRFGNLGLGHSLQFLLSYFDPRFPTGNVFFTELKFFLTVFQREAIVAKAAAGGFEQCVGAAIFFPFSINTGRSGRGRGIKLIGRLRRAAVVGMFHEESQALFILAKTCFLLLHILDIGGNL